jgi:GT2 family glycosyltransferase
MTDKPELSIVIVSYNTQDMTRECLESVYANAIGLALEVIVVDNASSDGSVEMIEQAFPAALLIKNADNRGFAAANNQAFAVARGDFILLLNSDTVILGDALQRSLEYLRRNPEAGAMACRALNTDRTVQLTCSEYPSHLNLLLMTTGLDRLPWPKVLGKYQMRHWRRDSERDVEVISGCYLLIRRPAFEQVGLLDEGFFFFFGEETDWCRRLRDLGWKLRFAPVGEYIHHGGGSARKLRFKRDLMLSEAMIRLHAKHGGRAAALLTFLILTLFNATRAVFWTLLSPLGRRFAERARHFRRVILRMPSTWPQEA